MREERKDDDASLGEQLSYCSAAHCSTGKEQPWKHDEFGGVGAQPVTRLKMGRTQGGSELQRRLQGSKVQTGANQREKSLFSRDRGTGSSRNACESRMASGPLFRQGHQRQRKGESTNARPPPSVGLGFWATAPNFPAWNLLFRRDVVAVEAAAPPTGTGTRRGRTVRALCVVCIYWLEV